MQVSNKDERFIQKAAEQASQSPCLMRHGCVAVINGRVVGRGYNNYRCVSRDGFIHNCMTCHAEMAALREVNKLSKNFKKVILYVVRLDAKNTLQESGPCVDCMNKILTLNIKRIFHSVNGGKIVVRHPTNYNSEHITTGRRLITDVKL